MLQLRTDDGEVAVNHEEMCQLVKDYYKRLFDYDVRDGEMVVETGSKVITEEQNRKLVAEFTFQEFTYAIKLMYPEKSSDLDVLNPDFFQHFWHMCGKEVYHCCKNWLHDQSFPSKLNDTNIVLIPRKEHAESMKDLLPIALCNVYTK